MLPPGLWERGNVRGEGAGTDPAGETGWDSFLCGTPPALPSCRGARAGSNQPAGGRTGALLPAVPDLLLTGPGARYQGVSPGSARFAAKASRLVPGAGPCPAKDIQQPGQPGGAWAALAPRELGSQRLVPVLITAAEEILCCNGFGETKLPAYLAPGESKLHSYFTPGRPLPSTAAAAGATTPRVRPAGSFAD